MNLQKLFDMQRKLDEHIEREHPRKPDEDRLAKKILALQVELGELANEARFFKYWSHDQEPRNLGVPLPCEHCEGTGRDGYEPLANCWCCGGTGLSEKRNISPLLEEFVDCLHFLLSIGNDINMNEVYEDYEPKPLYFGDGDILGQFIVVYDWINSLYFHRHEDVNGEIYDLVFAYFLGLGEMLGFSWEEVEQAYMKKNEENHSRQERGY
ncbi:dUTP diphosphatase [Saccharococcus caldoxylosilyticus]|uniref:Dimeric dUTPase n=1 Tax=Saccharococcus caldoxylosilyticus TaxID=81408 RepID=A0A150L5U7_9BACL|nr:dUTP diphosphatase [Parageobacillus caldoxylosilyticus]KYD07665.1 Dimeric dUTPase [Parageobacillus caldoxylosilyticus]